MDDLFDIVEDETLSFDDDKNENDIKKKTEIKDEPAKKESILEKYGENLTTKLYVTNPAIARPFFLTLSLLTLLSSLTTLSFSLKLFLLLKSHLQLGQIIFSSNALPQFEQYFILITSVYIIFIINIF